MGKLEEYQKGRNEGMDFALRIVRKDGLDGLETEIKKRGITGISINLSHKELEAATANMRNMMFDTYMAFTLGILHDVFGFGPKRAEKFVEHFDQGTELMLQGAITWDEILQRTDEILKKKVQIRYNDRDTRLKREY